MTSGRKATAFSAFAALVLAAFILGVTFVDAALPSTPTWHPAHDRYRRMQPGGGGHPGREPGIPSDAPLPECGFHLYRHLSKTGGTTLRFVFDKQTAMGEWEYPLTYGFKEAEWEGLLGRWRAAAGAWSAGERAEGGPRTLVEVRGNWPSNWPAENFERVMRDVADLRQHFEPLGCVVSTSLLLRRPFQQYLSFYNYYIKKHQTAAPGNDANRRWPDVLGEAAWGRDLGEWASNVRDMQVREVLGNKCTSAMRQPGYDVEWRGGEPVRLGQHAFPAECAVREEDYARFERTIREFDVVGTTEQFDSFLLLLAHKTGLQHLQYVRSNEGKHDRGRDSVPESTMAAIDAATAYDSRAYELVEERHAELVRAMGGAGFEAKVRAFQAATTIRGGKKFVGGLPATSPFKWVDKKAAEAAGAAPVVPGCFTEPTGGGQAIAYIIFDPVVLVKRDASLSCVKGCNMDA